MPIRLRTFGGLQADLDGREVDWLASRSQPAALLVYLAVERSATRDQLQALLWPEGESDSAAHRLRNTVYELRQILGADSIATKGRELRVTESIQADVLELERAIELGHHAIAVELYRGPFLAGVHLAESTQLESWIDARRLKYTRLFRQASRAQIRARIQADDLAGALAAARAWVAPDLLDDEAEHQLIELLVRSGERAEALSQYETYSRLLKQDDLEPLDETRALVEGLERETSSPRTRAVVSRPIEQAVRTDHEPGIAAGSAPPVGKRRSRWLFAAGALVVATGVAAAAWQLTASGSSIDPQRVAVVPLVNQTGTDSLQAFGALAAMVLTDGLRRTNLVHVVPTASVMAANAAQAAGRTAPNLAILAQETGAGLVVQGAYFVSRDSLIIQPEIVDVRNNRVAFSIERVIVPASEQFAAIQLLLERVLVTLSGRLDDRLAGLAQGAALTDLPMSLEAYREFATGLERFWEWNLNRSSLPHFARAVQLDSTSATALLWNAWSDWLQNANLPNVDSLLKRVEQKTGDLSPFDLVILEWLRAWIDGDLTGAHRASVRWTDIGGGVAHTEAAYDAFRLNRVDEARARIEKALAIPSNRRFPPTWYVLNIIQHVKGEHEEALRATRGVTEEMGGGRILELRPLAALGRIGDMRVRLQELKAANPTSYYFQHAAAELRWHGHSAEADEVGRLAASWYREALAAQKADQPLSYGRSKRYLTLRLAGTLFDLGEFEEARALYEAIAAEPMPSGYSYDYYFAYDLEPLGYLGIDAARRGDRAAAEGYIRRLVAVDRPYLFGNDFHWQARITAALGECERTVDLLQAGLANGAAYWQWAGFPLLREVPEFTSLSCPAMKRFLEFKD